ncbi:MAG: hypothetical protein FJ265_06210, partial [Planctomycetes bacterium]|nr:hypothetical protein [Planctomycetota bacterium]
MESTAPFAVPMRRACILLVAAAVLFAALALAGCSRRVVRDPEVVRLVEAIATEEESFEFEDDYIRAPIALGDLIKRGAGAVPTLLDMLPETNDEWTAMMMLEAIGRIGDPRAREPVERLLTSPARGIAEKALAALVRLGPQQSIPAMRALLERPDCGGFRRAHLLCTLLLAGGDSAIEPTIDLGLANENERSDAIEALLQHEPLRTVLGLKQAGWIGLEEEPLLRAAKEWVLERRGQPSPWKPAADFAFAEPFAAEKQQAFDLVRQKGWLAEGGVRILPVDVAVPDTVPREPVAVLFSGGHAHSIAFDVWQPHGDFVRFHRFHADFRWVQSAFPETEMQESYAVADAPIAAVQRAVAGMRAALATRVLPWWNGPDSSSRSTSAPG